MFREVLTLAARGYHLRKITEQLSAVDNLKHYLGQEIERLQAE